MKKKVILIILPMFFLSMSSCNSNDGEQYEIAVEQKSPFSNDARNNSLAISSDEKFAVVSNSGQPIIKIYDLATKQLVKDLNEFVTPRNIVFSLDNSHIYITDSGSGDLVEIETLNFTIVGRYPIGKGVFGSHLSANGSSLYINNAADHQVVIFDLINKKILQRIDGFNQPRQGIALHKQSGTFFITNFGNNKVQILSANSNKIVGEITGFNNIRGISVSNDGKNLYAASSSTNNISIVDIPSRKIVKTIDVGKEPYGAALSPNNMFLLSGNAGDNTLSYINLSTNKVENTISGFIEPRQAISYSNDGNFAYVLNRDLSISKVSIAEKKIIYSIIN